MGIRGKKLQGNWRFPQELSVVGEREGEPATVRIDLANIGGTYLDVAGEPSRHGGSISDDEFEGTLFPPGSAAVYILSDEVDDPDMMKQQVETYPDTAAAEAAWPGLLSQHQNNDNLLAYLFEAY